MFRLHFVVLNMTDQNFPELLQNFLLLKFFPNFVVMRKMGKNG